MPPRAMTFAVDVLAGDRPTVRVDLRPEPGFAALVIYAVGRWIVVHARLS
ncbi:MAG: hypothetical protein ACYCZK_01875 [Microbacteriaceae bacterium]